MENMERKLELILTYLLGRSDIPPSLRDDLEQLAADPETPDLLARLEHLLSQQDDPGWIEALAAASEGVILPEVADFLSDRDDLARIEPDLVDQFDSLLTPSAADDLADWPDFPTLVQQLAAQQSRPPASEPEDDTTWKQGRGFRWQQLKEKRQVVIQVLSEALNTAALNLASTFQSPTGSLAYAGRTRSGRNRKTLLQLELKEAQDMEVTLIAEANPRDPNHATVIVEVNIPSRGGWPHLGQIEVTLKQGELALQSAVTDDFGKAVFAGLTEAQLSQLVVEIVPES